MLVENGPNEWAISSFTRYLSKSLAIEIVPILKLAFLFPKLCETHPTLLSRDIHSQERMIALALSYLLP